MWRLDAALINYLPFDGTPGSPLNNYNTNLNNSRTNFEAQNGDTGYQFANSSPLTYGNLQTTSSYGVGGGAYTRGNITIQADFQSDWDNLGSVSSPFTRRDIDRGSVWNSILLRDDRSGGDPLSYSMGVGAGIYNQDPNRYLFGITGGNDGAYSVRYKSNDNTITSQVLGLNIATGQTDFLLFNVEFGDGTGNITYNFWLNPTIGSAGPGAADFSQSVAWSTFDSNSSEEVGIDSFYYYPGNANNDGSIDEFRLGNDFASVTPLAALAAPVPETSTVLLGCVGALMMLRRRRG